MASSSQYSAVKQITLYGSFAEQINHKSKQVTSSDIFYNFAWLIQYLVTRILFTLNSLIIIRHPENKIQLVLKVDTNDRPMENT